MKNYFVKKTENQIFRIHVGSIDSNEKLRKS